jgi:ubiquitin-conjugating enzyme E2 J2
MITPSGRFEVNKYLCLSISNFHPESWSPSWSVSTILTGLVSFMTGDDMTTGAIRSSDLQQRQLAAASVAFNLKNQTFLELFSKSLAKMGMTEELQEESV